MYIVIQVDYEGVNNNIVKMDKYIYNINLDKNWMEDG